MHPLNSSRLIRTLTLACVGLWACASAPQRGDITPDSTRDAVEAPIVVPQHLNVTAIPRQRVATGLPNPRGMHILSDASMLVAIAGTGDPATPNSGGVIKLTDRNHDGDFDDENERQMVLGAQPSSNIIQLVHRDEVFGMASITAGGGDVLASLALFGGPSTIFRIATEGVSPWSRTHINANDLAYDARRNAWLAVGSTSDELVELTPGGPARRLVKFPPLAEGQDAVPAYLRVDPITGHVLVTLFSGSPAGEEGGTGTDLVLRSSAIVRVDPETRRVHPLVTGLTASTDLEVAPDGSIYVLEFCNAFADPVDSREAMLRGPVHGGFRRFSGRLLRVDRAARTVTVVADGLDTPTNLAHAQGALWIAQGMGTPGRPIPTPDGGSAPLTGFIERLPLSSGE